MISRLILRLATRLSAAHITRAAYLGILGRPADPGGLAAYSRELRRTGRLDRMLADMASSQEALKHGARRHAADILPLVYRAIRGNDPMAEDVQTWGRRLDDDQDLFSIVQSVVEDSAARSRSGNEDLIRAAFQGLLGREVDAEALVAYSQFLESTGDVAAFLRDLGTSREHRKALLRGPISA